MGGNVTRVASSSGNTDYTYDGAGRVLTRTYPNQVKVSYNYDTASRVTQMKYENIATQPPLLKADDRPDPAYHHPEYAVLTSAAAPC